MTATVHLLAATLAALPAGIIVLDADDRVVTWNDPAERFIKYADRPTLFEGMHLDFAHEGPSQAGMAKMMQAIREGRVFPPKEIERSGLRFRVHYKGLFGDDETYLGIAQVIEFLDPEPKEQR